MGKKILFVFRTLGTGGAEKIQGFVANACANNGYDVTILSLSDADKTIELDPKIKIIYQNYDNISVQREKYIIYIANRIKFQFRLRKKILDIDPDLICVFLSDIVRMVTLSLRGTKYPVIGSERGDPHQFSDYQIKEYTKAYNRCAAVVFQLKELIHFYNLNPEIILKTIPNPSILRNNMPQDKSTSEPFIFSGGRLHKQKRFDVLIKAYKIVQEKYPNYKLRIYGEGEELENLSSLVSKLNLKNQVIFMGDKRNIFESANNKSIFVLSSDYEGIPNVISESLLYGVPTISTDTSPGGARLLLNNGENGDIVPIEDYEELAKSIIKYIENPEYVADKVSKGREYIKKFNPDEIERQWLELIKEVLNNE